MITKLNIEIWKAIIIESLFCSIRKIKRPIYRHTNERDSKCQPIQIQPSSHLTILPHSPIHHQPHHHCLLWPICDAAQPLHLQTHDQGLFQAVSCQLFTRERDYHRLLVVTGHIDVCHELFCVIQHRSGLAADGPSWYVLGRVVYECPGVSQYKIGSSAWNESCHEEWYLPDRMLPTHRLSVLFRLLLAFNGTHSHGHLRCQPLFQSIRIKIHQHDWNTIQ